MGDDADIANGADFGLFHKCVSRRQRQAAVETFEIRW
jgi:hypothetical protein